MKKGNYLIIIITLLLLVIAGIFLSNKKTSTLAAGSDNFAIEDTGKINKIFLADRNGNTVSLEKAKGSGEWVVNKKYPIRKDAIKTLLSTFKNLRVKSPVSKSARNTVIKDIAAVGTKVEIYMEGNLVKTYYVGRETPDNLGTYMIEENAPNAFITDIPGFNGYLTPRYITSESEWRSQAIFNYAPGEISKLKLECLEYPENSFEIQVQSMDKFSLLDGSGKKVLNSEPIEVFSFLSRFQQINYEAFAKVSEKVRDSVLKSRPIYIYHILDHKGNSTELKIYRKYAIPGEKVQLNAQGKPSPFDTARMYAKMNGVDQLLLIQYFVFDKIMPSILDLRQKQKK